MTGTDYLGVNMKNDLIPSGYNTFLKDIKQRIRTAQYEALKSVNKELIMLYWDIGSKIVDSQKKHGWGKAIFKTLVKDLQKVKWDTSKDMFIGKTGSQATVLIPAGEHTLTMFYYERDGQRIRQAQYLTVTEKFEAGRLILLCL